MQSFPIGLRAQQNLRFCGRLYIGALRSPLSPFAPSRRSLLVPSPQRPPSPREGDRPQAVEGVPHPSPVEKFPFSAPPGSPVGQALRPCRRLYIGALRSPLSPVAPPEDTRSSPRNPSPKTSLLEGGGPPAGGGRSFSPVPGGKVPFFNPTGFTRRPRPPALPPIAYRGFAVAPITLRPSQRYLLVPRPPPQRPPSSREGDRPQAVEGVPRPHSVEGVPPSHPAYSEPFSRIALSTPSLLRYPSISRITVSGGSGVPASAQILTACIRNSLSL